MNKILLDPFEEAMQLAGQRGNWIVGVVETQVYWPTRKQLIFYEDKQFLLLPNNKPSQFFNGTPSPGIAIRADTYGLTREQARQEIMCFASALAWSEENQIEIVSWAGGRSPESHGIPKNIGISRYLSSEFMPTPINEAGKTALAFFREGISLSNPFYSFLSLYKAFSIAVPNGRDRNQWIKNKRKDINYPAAKERLVELETGGTDVSDYLYRQCRHAIAHADNDQFVNPDNTDDHYRLSQDLPLIRNFAELAIEEGLGIKRKSTIYSEHLYELEGFRKIFTSEFIESLKSDSNDLTVTVDVPDNLLFFAKKEHEQFPLPEMRAVEGFNNEDGILLVFESKNGVIKLQVFIDFTNEKLRFDPQQDICFSQNHEKKECIKEELAGIRFQLCILSNGHLEIWNESTVTRLGMSEGYIPLNCFVNHGYFDQHTRKLEELIKSHAGEDENKQSVL